MKIILLILLMPFFSKAQQILHEKDGIIMYTGVVNVDSSLKKAELFNRAKAWIATEYNSANAVIQMEDKDAGILIGKGIFNVSWSTNLFKGLSVRVDHTIKLYFKDGKYKYEITDLSYQNDSNRSIKLDNDTEGMGKKTREKFLHAIDDEILATINSLEDAMNKPVSVQDF